MTLAAFANVGARAAEYKDSRAFPDARMDQLRALAYLDLLNGVTAADRIARASARARADADARAAKDADTDGAAPNDSGTGEPGPGDFGTDDPGPDGSGPGGSSPDGSGPGGSGTDEPGAGGSSPDGSGPGGSGAGEPGPSLDDPDGGDPGDDAGGPGGGQPGGGPSPAPEPEPGAARLPALQDLIVPLRTLLGRAAQPGQGRNLGPLDPALARDLAAAAAISLRSEWCVTVTDAGGFAIAHGCARPGRRSSDRPAAPPAPPAPAAAFPARVNLTIPLSALPGLLAPRGSPGSPRGLSSPSSPGSPWVYTPRDDPGPPGGCGTWTLALPGGRDLIVRLGPVPVFDCDHRHESRAYQPNGTLRHLVQVRDGECTFPTCSRHARESDFEHAVPYDKGGRTCACNTGARSRRCHRVKQSPGWNLTQPKPGRHQWTTPAGRVYTQGPQPYPA